MNKRLMTILFSAFVIAAICAFLVYRMVGVRLAGATHAGATTKIVAAATDIKLGTVLTTANLTTIDISGPLPKGAITNPATAIGRGVISNLYEGEAINESRLAPAGSGGGLAATIKQGMRACAVKVDEVVGVAGFVTPGERVDVLISGTPPGEIDPKIGSKVKTLLQNIEVLSAGTDIQKDGTGKPQQVQVVNLLVAPDQAELLSLASAQTHIQLVLRNPLDTTVTETSGSAMGNLFADKNAPVSKPVRVMTPKAAAVYAKAAPPAFFVQVMNGSKTSQEKFATSGGNQ